MEKQLPATEKSFVKADNPDDLEGTIPRQTQGDSDTLVERDNPDDVDADIAAKDPN